MQAPIRYHQMLVSPHVGGGAKLALEIHRHVVSSRGGGSQLLLPGGGEAERAAVAAGAPFTPYRVDRLTGAKRLPSLYENCRLLAATAKHGSGVVHVHAPFVYGAARPFLGLSRLKSVLHIHLDFTAEELRWALRSPPDLIITCAEFMKPAVEAALGERGGAATRIGVVRNAVDLRRFRPGERQAAKARIGIGGDEPLLMMVANIAPHKGQATAVRAVADLHRAGRLVRLWIVGGERSDGMGHLAELKALTADLGIADRVEFAGFRNDIPDLLQAADYVLLPSTSEGLPLSILEAQASGAVVLAAPTAGIPEVIEDGRTGFLVQAGDHETYAARIAALIENPALAQHVRASALDYVVAEHDMGRYCSKILAEYDHMLASPSAEPLAA